MNRDSQKQRNKASHALDVEATWQAELTAAKGTWKERRGIATRNTAARYGISERRVRMIRGEARRARAAASQAVIDARAAAYEAERLGVIDERERQALLTAGDSVLCAAGSLAGALLEAQDRIRQLEAELKRLQKNQTRAAANALFPAYS